jgi:phage terminase small subunit
LSPHRPKPYTHTMMPDLTPKQERFCREYVVDLHIGNAALRAGYSVKNAAQQGSRLLKKPSAAALVAKLHREKMQRFNIRAENVLSELARIAFGDVRELLDDSGNLRPLSEMSDEAAASIASFEVGTNSDGSTKVARIKTWNKNQALEQLCRHLGLLRPEQHEHMHMVAHFSEDQLASCTDAQLLKIESAYQTLAEVTKELQGESGDLTGHVVPEGKRLNAPR